MKTKEPRTITTVSIDPTKSVGQIKLMNAVNNGPSKARSDQSRGNFDSYKAARLPYARIHDANWCSTYGAPHTVDITAIFPDFNADVNDPASYDFAMTDNYLATIVAAGTEVFYRLGQSIEHGVKKYGIMPPKDNKKWAEICEHVIRHYTEGWANGYKWKITYWEIWNEPDLGVPPDGPVTKDPKTWGGTAQQFFDLYRISATHLKKCFPKLKIGGPALAGGRAFGEAFLAEMKKYKAPLDFLSWHLYASNVDQITDACCFWRELLDKYGFKKAESILNEWNYVKDWSPCWVYSLDVESGTNNLKSAALTAGVMCACQNRPIDMLMYYDARLGTRMNGLFDNLTYEPLKGYYPFYAWAKLLDLGTQVKADVEYAEVKSYAFKDACNDLNVTAAISKNGKHGGALIARFNDDNNVVYKRPVKVTLAKDAKFRKVTCHLTDSARIYTEVPVEIADDGSFTILLDPNSFAYVEW